MTNWGKETVVVEKDSVISYVELVTLVDPEDTLWKDDQTATVARIDASEIPREQKEDLELRLAIGTSCSA